MKIISVLAVYAALAVLLGWGIYNAAKGHFGPLAVSAIAFIIMFGKFGCLPPAHD